MNEMCSDRKKLMQEIGECEFMMIDIGLFLDTHPDCTQALAQFAVHRMSYDRNVAEYERNYGPLTMYAVSSDNYWSWIGMPWPWEMEAY